MNPEALRDFRKRNIIANPNCSTIQMVVALKPLHDEFKIKRIVVATYQSVSGAGKEGMDELFNHTKSSFVFEQSPPEQFTKEIAFNCIPHIDKFMDDGATKEEWKMVVETQKILDPAIAVHATCVRVPVFIGHGEAVNVEFERRSPPAKPERLCATHRAWRSSMSARTAATSPRWNAPGRTRCLSAASARTRRWRTVCRSGVSPTTSGKALR